MANISKISTLTDGFQRQEDLSTNTVLVGALQVNGTLLSQVAVAASFSGTIAGTSTSVVITANTSGTGGNSIALVFTGSNTISAEIATWNGAHPTNQATLTSGNGSQIPTSGTTTLSGGISPGASQIGSSSTYVNFTPTSSTVAGALQGIDAALTSSGSTQRVDKFTLNNTDITNGFVTLSFIPTIAGNTILLVEDASNMFYGVDFSVSSNQLNWSGLALNGLLASGDNLTVTYST